MHSRIAEQHRGGGKSLQVDFQLQLGSCSPQPQQKQRFLKLIQCFRKLHPCAVNSGGRELMSDCYLRQRREQQPKGSPVSDTKGEVSCRPCF